MKTDELIQRIEQEVASGSKVTVTFEQDPNSKHETPVRMVFTLHRKDDKFAYGEYHMGTVKEFIEQMPAALLGYLKLQG